MELQDLTKGRQEPKYFPLEAESEISCFSKIFFTWIHKVLTLGTQIHLEREHTFPLPKHEEVTNERLTWALGHYRLFFAVIRSNLSIFISSTVLCTLAVLMEFSGPVYMELLIDYINSPDKPFSYGLLLAASFTAITMCYPIINTQRNFNSEIMAMRIRIALYNLIYNKTILSTNLPEGLGINLLQVDVTKIYEFFWFAPYIMNVPLQLGIAIYLIYSQVGEAVWVALATMVLAMIGNLLLSGTCKRANEAIMGIRDERMEHSTQLLTEIKMIKAYSWEDHFVEKIQGIRKAELSKMRFLNLLYSCNLFYFWSLPSLTVVVVLGYYTVVMGQDINTSKAFVTLTTLFLLQIPLIGIPIMMSRIIQLVVSHKRIHELIDAKPWAKLPHSDHISLKNCTFAYGDKVILKNLNLDIADGEFLAVIGPVGCGKSSLLLGLMGELPLESGNLDMNTDVAYAPSLDSWLLNATMRENITLGREFKEDWYWKVVEACCLLPDISSLPARDNTEIGERGINLSGGQKARVCLARAVYAEKQVYLLDDPLSSVDNHVAQHIFSQCFQKLLKGKTRILVTHRHNFLDRVDRVVELKNGEISHISSAVTGIDLESDEEESPEESANSENKNEPLKDNKLIEDEDREVGEVDREVYLDYFKYSGSYIWVVLGVISMMLFLGTKMLGDMYLKDWANHPGSTDEYLPYYMFLRLGGCVFILFRSVFLNVIMSIKISYKAHEKLLQSFVRAPINLFYDVTPLGRLLNRLSKDINMIDEEVAFTVGSVLANISNCVGCILMGLIFFPYLMILIPIVFIPARYICRVYLKSSRELTRLESISRSPMLNHFEETLSGAKFIRVFRQTDYFISQNHQKINNNVRISYSLCGCQQWSRLNLGFLSATLLCALFIIAVVFREDISVGVVGLCLTYMIPLPEDLSDLLMSVTELENNMVSVERVRAYTKLPVEQAVTTSADIKNANWPDSLTIEFHKVYMKYRPNTDLVLKGLTFEIPPACRVGITGRTGSGKSSLFLALLRIVEVDSGVITIGGVNIALLGLQKLRQAITLIPQDPLVFNGTMKENLDPFGHFEERVIKKVLDEVDLKFGLDYDIKNGGQNISIGERQLLSLSRALLCKSKIILFDEATAGIDPVMDAKVQKIIKNKFLGCTILTIAHRLGTIIDSDLVLLLADGKLKEMGTPAALMSYESEFKSLAESMH